MYTTVCPSKIVFPNSSVSSQRKIVNQCLLDTMMTCGVVPKLVVALAMKYLAINTWVLLIF